MSLQTEIHTHTPSDDLQITRNIDQTKACSFLQTLMSHLVPLLTEMLYQLTDNETICLDVSLPKYKCLIMMTVPTHTVWNILTVVCSQPVQETVNNQGPRATTICISFLLQDLTAPLLASLLLLLLFLLVCSSLKMKHEAAAVSDLSSS